MIQLSRTNSDNPGFVVLVKLLDADLAERDGSEHAFYAQFNKIDKIKHVVVAYENGAPVACGAMKEWATGIMEVKRMYTLPANRGKGIAATILAELEAWAAELGYHKCLLETGKKQPEAIALYQKSGYNNIPNYGQYAGVDNSICFEKIIGQEHINYNLVPIGFVESILTDRETAPNQPEGAPEAWINLNEKFLDGLDGLRVGQSIIVLTWFHQSQRDVLKLHPQWNKNNPLTGVFATRSPDRPNPIGLHQVNILKIEANRIKLSSLEAIDGTPVVDIKPAI